MTGWRPRNAGLARAVLADKDYELAYLYAEYTGGGDSSWTSYVSPTMELQVRGVLSGQDVTTESFRGTIKIFDMTAIRDPAVPGDVDVSACFDNAAAANTSLSSGAVLPGQSPSDRNYYRYTDQLAQAPSGQWQVVSDYPLVYYPRAKGVQAVRKRRFLLAGLLALAALSAGLVAAAPARAADGSSSVGCSTGSSCYIELQKMIHFGGNYSPGANNVVVNITPPACLWIPIGDAHSGSQYVLTFYGTDPGPGAPFDGHHAFAEAQQLVNANPMPAGEWYYLPVNPADNPAQVQDCLNQLPCVDLGGRWRALLDSR